MSTNKIRQGNRSQQTIPHRSIDYTERNEKKNKQAMKFFIFCFAILFAICAEAEENVATVDLRMVSVKRTSNVDNQYRLDRKTLTFSSNCLKRSFIQSSRHFTIVSLPLQHFPQEDESIDEARAAVRLLHPIAEIRIP